MKKCIVGLLVMLSFSFLKGQTVIEEIPIPEGYKRVQQKTGTFGNYLRTLPLFPLGTKVLLYNGEEKQNQTAAYAVVNMDIGKRDLQQCADAIIRLRAEYLYQQKRYSDIQFNFMNGFTAEYLRWAKGERIKVEGNKVSWYLSKGEDYSYPTFRAYLDEVFIYAGTASLAKELKSVDYSSMQPGDVLIQGGFPGHAVIVVDRAIDSVTGKTLFLLAQSYMPAQNIHVLVNPQNQILSPWYELEENKDGKIYTPEWTFEKTDLKRFE